jgi:small GTP-binding protein
MMLQSIPLIKVVIAGNGNVGKTSLVRRYCEGRFETSRVMTIGVDFQTKVVKLDERTVKLSIWDVAGQERFAMVREGFYRGAQAAVLVYSLTDPQSLLDLPRWREEITRRVPLVRLMVVGNKLDMAVPGTQQAGIDYASSIKIPIVFTSAMNGQGVNEMFITLAGMAINQINIT